LQGEEKNTDYAKVNMQDIPTEEIDSYVNENETLAEIDWQSEINTVGMAIDNETGDNLIQDSNTKQN
jgi:predicted house-cleaning NTP pyrophosphatase (Maf/HAM1 superfamily)